MDYRNVAVIPKQRKKIIQLEYNTMEHNSGRLHERGRLWSGPVESVRKYRGS